MQWFFCKKSALSFHPQSVPPRRGKTRTEKMSNVSPRSAYSFIPGKSLCMEAFSHAHRSPQDRSCSAVCMEKEKPLPHGVQNGLFRYRYSVPDTVWSHCAKLSLEANESAKSPSPSLAGQSVIVNQAGLLAPVHRSSASSQRSLSSDCQLNWRAESLPVTVA